MRPEILYPLLAYVFVAGLCVGSFLNVVIYRLPLGQSLVRPGSRCPKCHTKIRWYHNVPVASFLWLRGRCAKCRVKISWRYPAVELLTGLLFLAAAAKYQEWIYWPFAFYFVAALVACTWIDLDHWILPDKITLPGILIGLLSSVTYSYVTPWESLLGLLFGGGILYLIAWGYQLATKKDGLGGGDIKFLAMVGAFLGFQGALITLLLSSMIGSLLGIFLMVVKGKRSNTAIPFGPFLAGGAGAAFFFGPEIWRWYFQMH